MSHRHRTSISPPPPSDLHPMNNFGFKVPMDSTAMDEALVIVTSHPEILPYVDQTMELSGDSKVFQAILRAVKSKSGATEENKLLLMYAYGFLTGSSVAVAAVDLGYIEDSSGGEDDYDDGGNEG